MKQSITTLRNLSVALVSFALLLTSCSKDKDAVPVQGAEFDGKYTVVEPSETYTLEIRNKGGANFEIKEFGGFLNVPLKAVFEGNALKIPSQTFTNPNGKSLTIKGVGTLVTKAKKDDTVRFEYEVSGFTAYEGDFEGTRQ